MEAKRSGLKGLPFQVQISYTRRDGTRSVRVITQQLAISDDAGAVQSAGPAAVVEESEVDLDIVAANAARKSAKFVQRGEYERARRANLAATSFLQQSAHHRPDKLLKVAAFVRNAGVFLCGKRFFIFFI